MTHLHITPYIVIPLAEFEFSFARSGGPGGQNVNKVNSKAIMRWSLPNSPSVPDAVKERFTEKFGNRLTLEGELILTSQKHRDQASNVSDCLEKAKRMLESVAQAPTKRRPTKPSLAAKKRRLESKTLVGQKKRQRQSPRRFDD